MKLNHLIALVVVAAFGLAVQVGAAQYGSDQSKTKTTTTTTAKTTGAKTTAAAKAGGSHTMTGCLAKGDEPNTWKLTQIEGNGPKEAELINAPATLNLNAHVGHKVAITGANVSTRAAARTETGAKKPAAAEQKEEAGEHHMRPTALKMIAPSCS